MASQIVGPNFVAESNDGVTVVTHYQTDVIILDWNTGQVSFDISGSHVLNNQVRSNVSQTTIKRMNEYCAMLGWPVRLARKQGKAVAWFHDGPAKDSGDFPLPVRFDFTNWQEVTE